MRRFQRPPLEANAAIGRTNSTEQLRYATTRLLEASSTRRPYAGAIIRHALSKSVLTLLRRDDEGKPGSAADHPAFLAPITAAIEEWWPSQTMARGRNNGAFRIETDFASREAGLGWHTDQIYRHDQGDRPLVGPITAIAVVTGGMRYSLCVPREHFTLNVVSDDKMAYLNEHAHELQAKAGDVVLLTNIPATYHASHVVQPSERIVYMTPLGVG